MSNDDRRTNGSAPETQDWDLADREARARIQGEHGTSFVVEAAAGTGKTTALVGRLVSMLLAGSAELSSVIVTTFTDKAAGELTLRLRAEIERERERTEDPVLVGRLVRALAELETAKIGTFHSLCAELLRERPLEAGIDPAFAVLAEDEARALMDRALSDWLEQALVDPPEGLRRVLGRRTWDETPREVLAGALSALSEHRDHDAPWRREPWDRVAAIDAALASIESLRPLADASTDDRDPLAKSLASLVALLDATRERETRAPRDHDALELILSKAARSWDHEKTGRGKLYAGRVRTEVVALRDAVVAELAELGARAEADLAYCLRRDLTPALARYELLKRRTSRLDYVDLLTCTRRLLMSSEAVRRELAARVRHVLVDEVQDTDPLQLEIVLLLSSDDPSVGDPWRCRPAPGRLFVVGDPKQSIYLFRRADVAPYARFAQYLASPGAVPLVLTRTFRSTPAICGVVNDAFAPVMNGDTHHARYVPLVPTREVDASRQPSVIALPVPAPYGRSRTPTKWAVTESLPDAVGAFVHWLLSASGWRVRELATGAEVPIEPRHVCLLFKRLRSRDEDVPRDYTRALEARGIPHVLAGGRSFHEREEVRALVTAITAIEWPDDELALYGALRGPLFALTDAQLYLWKKRFGLSPLRPVDDVDALPPELAEVARALGVLRELHLARNRVPLADTIARLLEATGAHAALALAQNGELALANVARIAQLARRLESRGASSFRALATRLEEDAQRGEAGESAPVEEGEGGVRVMTVHKAKGLEFPVVIVCDPAAPAQPIGPSRWVDPERRLAAYTLANCAPIELAEHRDEAIAADAAETVRLAYVAATRARDLLVVPAVGDGPLTGGWLTVLERALHPSASERRRAVAVPGAEHVRFGEDSVITRSVEAMGTPDTSVRPGFHAALAGGHGVAWWDPSAISLGAEPPGGLRDETVLLKPDDGDDGSAAFEAWRGAHERALEVGREPTLDAQRLSEIARKPLALADVECEVEHVAIDAPRPSGRRFDVLLTMVLRELALDDTAERVAIVARGRGRAMGASEDEIDAARTAAIAALAHPRVIEARGGTRAVSVALATDAGPIGRGVIDVVHEQGASALALTFVPARDDGKEPSEAERKEHALAATALMRAWGIDVRAVLLVV